MRVLRQGSKFEFRIYTPWCHSEVSTKQLLSVQFYNAQNICRVFTVGSIVPGHGIERSSSACLFFSVQMLSLCVPHCIYLNVNLQYCSLAWASSALPPHYAWLTVQVQCEVEDDLTDYFLVGSHQHQLAVIHIPCNATTYHTIP